MMTNDEYEGQIFLSHPHTYNGFFFLIHHECERGIEKSVSRITVWHHKACQVMTNDDHEGWIFLSHPHVYNVFFFLLTIKAAYSVTFDILILEIKFLFFKNTVKILKFRLTFYHFYKF